MHGEDVWMTVALNGVFSGNAPSLIEGVINATGKAASIEKLTSRMDAVQRSEYSPERLGRKSVNDEIYGAQSEPISTFVRVLTANIARATSVTNDKVHSGSAAKSGWISASFVPYVSRARM
jgi:hypothetical protein